MKNKRTIFTLLVLSSVLASSLIITQVSARNMSRYESLSSKNIGFEERAKKSGIENPKQVEISLPSNKDSTNKIKSVEEMKGYIKDEDLKDGAKYITKKLMTYEEFINEYDADLSPEISKDRMIYVTATHYPNGFQHKKGFVKNAILIKYYDVESGELLGYGLKSLDKDGLGIERAPVNQIQK